MAVERFALSWERAQAGVIVAIPVLAVCALMLAPLPALAQDAGDDPAAQAQEVDLPREVRILVQHGLTFLGFDPGPADGLFGPKTRAAIWDWQAAKELDTTGYLTMPEAEALAAVGAEASEALELELEAPAAQEPDGMEAETATAPSGSQNEVIYFPECSASDAPDGCWRDLSSPAKCQVWVQPYYTSDHFAIGEMVTWSGGCQHNAAHGRGTLTNRHWSATGEIVEGKRRGRWVERGRVGTAVEGDVWEGPFVDGKMHGRWIGQFPNGSEVEGPFVDGMIHGQWNYRYADGTYKTKEWRHGELVP